MRKSNGWTMLVCALAAMATSAAQAQSKSPQSTQREQREFRVYDVSDILPEAVRAVAPGGMTAKELEQLNSEYGLLPSGNAYAKIHSIEPVTIAMKLASVLSLDSVILAPGVIGVLADHGGQDAFANALDALHDSYHERAAVRIAVYEVGAGATLTIGVYPDPDWEQPIRQIQQAVRRLVPTSMSSTVTHRFVQNVTSITGTGGYGYQGQVADITEGLDLTVRVGALNKDDGSLVDVQGELSRVSIRRQEMKGYINPPDSASGEASGRIELPTVDRRPIHSAVRVRDGEETIIAVMDNPDPDAESWLVVTVKVSAVR